MRTNVLAQGTIGGMADETSNSPVRDRIVSAADRLFYGRGIGNAGMDLVRDEAQVSLRALYKEFPSKEDLILAVLDRRHQTWIDGVEDRLGAAVGAEQRLLAIYDYLEDWFAEDDFRGCGFINAFGELGGANARVADAVRDHKASFQAFVDRLVADAGAPPALGPQLVILAEGAQTTAAIAGTPDAARVARQAAETLIAAAGRDRGPATRG